MDKQMIELYRERGLIPDWAYYQLNGKNIQENYNEQRKELLDKLAAAKLETLISKEVEFNLEKCLDKTLNNLLKDFKL